MNAQPSTIEMPDVVSAYISVLYIDCLLNGLSLFILHQRHTALITWLLPFRHVFTLNFGCKINLHFVNIICTYTVEFGFLRLYFSIRS